MSTVLVDRREGSADLLPMLQDMRIPSKLDTLEFGDVQLIGRGPEERPVLVGVEVKAPGDLLSSLHSGRLAGHQLPGLMVSYEVVYLVVEDLPWRRRDGRIQFGVKKPRNGAKYDQVMGELHTFENKLGVRLAFTKGRVGTAHWLGTLYHWWTSKAFDKHKSHLKQHRVEVDLDPTSIWKVDSEAFETRMKVAMALADGVGVERAKAAAAHFESPRAMLLAQPDEWEKVPGFGKKLAKRMWSEGRRLG